MENFEHNNGSYSVADLVAEALTQHVQALLPNAGRDASNEEDDLDEFWDNVPI